MSGELNTVAPVIVHVSVVVFVITGFGTAMLILQFDRMFAGQVTVGIKEQVVTVSTFDAETGLPQPLLIK